LNSHETQELEIAYNRILSILEVKGELRLNLILRRFYPFQSYKECPMLWIRRKLRKGI